MNPVEIAGFSDQWISDVDAGQPAVCVPFWELPLVPRTWEPMLSAMQVILAPTRFVRSACAAIVPSERLLHYPQAVFLPPGIEAARAAWGLSPDATVFVVAFDLDSDIERKNPWAAVRAFQRAFPSTREVQLVIKAKPSAALDHFAEQSAALRRMTVEDTRIRLVEASLTYADVLRLYASCDVLLSLHRAEGLGLHLMEAMSLGKVVVATNWSGNTDFMTPSNSVLVPYRLVPVATQHPSYVSEIARKGQVWAEPDVDAAAEALRAVHADPARRRVLAAAAANDMEERRRQMLGGAAFDALEDLLREQQGNPRRLVDGIRRSRNALRIAGVRHRWRLARQSMQRWFSAAH